MSTPDNTGLTLADLMRVEATETPDVFTGRTEAYGVLGIYGGHFLGQALAAGFETVDTPKLAQSFHAYFLRAGDPAARLDYHVTRLREGRRNDVRAIVARQNGNDVFHMTAAFKMPEPGDEHQKSAPEIGSAEATIAAREARGEPVFQFPVVKGGRVEMEFASPSFLEFDPADTPSLKTWMRVPGGETLDERMSQVVLAFLSDGTLMFNACLPHGKPFQTHRLTSLDQSVWFHHGTNAGDWMLFDQRSTAAADGRGMNEGEIFDAGGKQLITCAQESMLRRLEPAS